VTRNRGAQSHWTVCASPAGLACPSTWPPGGLLPETDPPVAHPPIDLQAAPGDEPQTLLAKLEAHPAVLSADFDIEVSGAATYPPGTEPFMEDKRMRAVRRVRPWPAWKVTRGAGVMVGVAPKSRMMTLRILDEDGRTSYSRALRAVVYAAENGARVVNHSWSGARSTWSSYALERTKKVFLSSLDAGVLRVCSAGNNSRDTSKNVPAYLGNEGYDSNHGSGVVDAAAATEQRERRVGR
jgi:hypothetical protein